MDGFSLIKQIRAVDKSIKVITLTAHSDSYRLLKATELKLTTYLVKPVSRSELKEALHLVKEQLRVKSH
ncbi:MAG: response regulator [Sulfurimonas sp.]